ncbi:medium-chain acyl-CoA ligase ACSF2, mitochondrial-like [Chironomus tepperi]|uniref:medium-chain acyl-CoA ligase ACSF2, mitochondrial-like n=1 Tax=Chironomus tepperi TaxID=113505 RepID=UPI00391EFB00
MIRKYCQAIPKISKRFCSSSIGTKLSYYHRTEGEPFKYITVGELLQNAAEKYGEKASLITYSEKNRISFAETLEKADRLASSLMNIGLDLGDRVAIWSPNYEFWYISMMAIARAGLVCVTLNPAYTINELNYCLEKVDIKAQKYFDMLIQSSKRESSLKHIIINGNKKLQGAFNYDDLLQTSSEYDLRKVTELQAAISPDSGAMIQFTSGTTGKPKATLLSHFGMINNSYFIGMRNEFHKKDYKLCIPLPLFHVGGCIISVLGSLHHGNTLVFPSPHFDGEAMLRSIVDENCNFFAGTPTFCVDLLAKQKSLNLPLPKIELACLGGADLSPQIVKDLKEVLKVERVTSVYGMTETSSAVFQTLPEDSNQSVEEFVGVVGNNVEAKIIDNKGNLVPFGQPGELCIRSKVNMIKYWNEPNKTKEILGEDGWLKTGDQFILYENGYGKICGRLKDMIIRGGENIFPKEIEDFLNTHDNILESQVIGVFDERMGEEVCALFRLKDQTKHLTQEDVKQFCKGNLAHFKIPKYTIIVNEFPKTPSGKIQKSRFTEFFKEQLENLK